ncbi:Gp19/Gp15/Gp42 family protein [Mycolicibacterium hippocampi]|uniref:Phage protein Pham7 n=2 Tax=Mycobacteriaceae TaxID=1762 RepID=A0A850PUQ1_9MYCO|nr:Gp19/Gp15/Gp42 family protein [Mycolicibacterium hippocampi]NVN51315.1 Phage protein Pham7 [Mycolicibacterium hippocampi]
MSYASPSDVSDRLGRPLSTDEASQVEALLSDAELLITTRIPDLDAKITADELSEQIVIMVESNAVVRLIRNPAGYTSETDGEYTYQVNWRLASGSLMITDHEWSLLGASSGAFAIDVRPRTWFERYYADAPQGVHPFMWGG